MWAGEHEPTAMRDAMIRAAIDAADANRRLRVVRWIASAAKRGVGLKHRRRYWSVER